MLQGKNIRKTTSKIIKWYGIRTEEGNKLHNKQGWSYYKQTFSTAKVTPVRVNPCYLYLPKLSSSRPKPNCCKVVMLKESESRAPGYGCKEMGTPKRQTLQCTSQITCTIKLSESFRVNNFILAFYYILKVETLKIIGDL